MSRLCGRPGCSEPGAVAYGMIPEDLLFWVAPHDPLEDPDAAVLCRRHADSMVVPIGWRLDDRRDAVPRLFRPPAPVRRPDIAAAGTERRSARRRRSADTTEQLELPDPSVLPADDPDDGADGHDVTVVDRTVERSGPDRGLDRVDQPAAWSPRFDPDDDLDGLLEATSPLLARAFRGADRPRR